MGSIFLRWVGLISGLLFLVTGCNPSREATTVEPQTKVDESAQPSESAKYRPRVARLESESASEAAPESSVAEVQPPLEASLSAERKSLMADAAAGNAAAQAELGNSYATGEFGRIDFKEAVKWLRAAADQGQPRGQALLGVMYSKGIIWDSFI